MKNPEYKKTIHKIYCFNFAVSVFEKDHKTKDDLWIVTRVFGIKKKTKINIE